MRRLPSLLVLALLPLFTFAAAPFPHEASDLKPDPQARFGKLPNGMRYVVRRNKEPKDRVSMRLLIEAGALHETEKQRGLAHFLEHLAFNGSENYKPGTMVEFFQRMGMSFGGDTNASTSFERTVYLLELPDTKDATIDEGLKVFGDFAGRLLLEPGEIDKERGIILSEKRTRDSVSWRTFVAQLNFLLEGTMFPKRLPIGEAEVIQNATREDFLDYFNAWYRPELTSIVAVGDMDPEVLEKKIVAAFTDFKARGPARPTPDLGKINPAPGTRAFYHFETEAPNTTVAITTIVPYTSEPDTAAVRLKYLPRVIANAIINRRLSELAKKEGAPFLGGSTDVSEYYHFYRQSVISLSCRADQWEPALAVADQELRRALEHGFQAAELKEVVATYRNYLEQAVKSAPTRRSTDLANEILDSLLERDVFTSPEDDLALLGPALEKVTVEDCVKALREAWVANHRMVLVTGNAKVAAPSASGTSAADKPLSAEEIVAAAYERSRAVAVQPPVKIEEATWAYTDFGPAGKVIRREPVADLDAVLLEFENGVRLNLKKTDFEANRIRISVRLGSGQLTEPADKPGLWYFTSQTYNDGGLGRHSADDLRRILAGKTVGAAFGVGADAFMVNAISNREDLLLALQLATARITDPGFRPEADRQIRKSLEQMYVSFQHTASGPLTLEVPRLISSGDPRFGLPGYEEIKKRTLEEVKAWVAPDRAKGAIEVAIVGDIDFDATIQAVAATLGALPTREKKPHLPERLKVNFPTQPFSREFTIETDIQKGVVRMYWPTTDARDARVGRRLTVLTEVLNDRLRLKLREELGDAYSPSASSQASDIYPGFGYSMASVEIDPPRAAQVAAIIAEIANDLAEKGTTDDEVARAKQPVLTGIREARRTNQYWLANVLSRAQERPELLEWARTLYPDFESISTEEITALAKKYLPSTRVSRVTVLPKPKPAPAAPTTSAATPNAAGR